MSSSSISCSYSYPQREIDKSALFNTAHSKCWAVVSTTRSVIDTEFKIDGIREIFCNLQLVWHEIYVGMKVHPQIRASQKWSYVAIARPDIFTVFPSQAWSSNFFFTSETSISVFRWLQFVKCSVGQRTLINHDNAQILYSRSKPEF